MNITRIINNKDKFEYIFKNGRKILDNKILEYIRKLSIPPSWNNVILTINSKEEVQAMGEDNKGRTQYIYSKEWVNNQEKLKFLRLKCFIKNINNIRKNINNVLKKNGWFKEKLIGLIINIIENCGLRIGNERYKDLYDTYGITTLTNKHIKILNNKVKLEFIGKKSVLNICIITENKLVKLIKELYKYNNKNKENDYFFVLEDKKILSNIVINNYLKQYGDYTIKDFRTYLSNIDFIKCLINSNIENTEYKIKQVINKCIDNVCIKLNNTRNVLKTKYICSIIIDKYLENPHKFNNKYKYYKNNTLQDLNGYESLLLYYLKMI